MSDHYVYTFWRGPRPLYVGCTSDLARRMKEHREEPWMKDATWIGWACIPDREKALEAEGERIVKLRPQHNRHYNQHRWQTVAQATAEHEMWEQWDREFRAAEVREEQARNARLAAWREVAG